MTYILESVDPRSMSDDAIAQLNAYGNALQAEAHPDDPAVPVEVTSARTRVVPAHVATEVFFAWAPDGTLAATANTWFQRIEENRHAISFVIGVRAEHRRRGLGKALLGLLADVAEREARPLILCVTSDRVPAGEVFARRVGAQPGMAVHTNRLVLDDLDRSLVERWISDGPVRAPGYSLFTIDGPIRDDLLDAYCDLVFVMNTAPRDGLDLEDQRLLPEHVRAGEDRLAAQGVIRWTLFARHDATGALAGYTQVFYDPKMPRTISQGDTAVHPDHRGRAIGKWLKATMLDRMLREWPQARDIRTGNADSNEPMLAINRALGFAPYEAVMNWQVRVEVVRTYLGSSV